MRLYEITTAITPDKFTPGKVSSPKDAGFGLGDEQEELGSGVFGSAFSTPSEPGTVRKIVGPIDEREFKNDAYFKYVQLLAKNDRFTGNPYFPRIYDVQVKKFPLDPNEPTTFYDYAYAVDLERLHDWGSISIPEAKMLADKMFYDFDKIASHHIQSNTKEDHNGRKIKFYDHALMDFLHDLFNSFSFDKKLTIFKDKHFKQAVMLMRSLHSKTRDSGQPMFWDIHSGNIMIRRGPGGPQLVITDPVAN